MIQTEAWRPPLDRKNQLNLMLGKMIPKPIGIRKPLSTRHLLPLIHFLEEIENLKWIFKWENLIGSE